VGVQFRRAAAMIHDYDAGDLPLVHDQRVVVEAERGEELGWTVGEPLVREAVPHDGVLRRVLRVATGEDLARDEANRTGEHEALRGCCARARQQGLPMKIVACERAHRGDKATFFFSAEGRVDFRHLVREQAQKLRARVEMRQIGPRDETKILGAVGPCGREVCCASWMRSFAPVGIRMAKDQALALNPQKVSGVCGRLLCCLAYEEEVYRDSRRRLPRIGKQVVTPQGPGRVVDVSVLRGFVRVHLDGSDGTQEFPAAEVRRAGAAEAEEPENEADSGDAPPAESEAAEPAAPATTAPAPAQADRPRPPVERWRRQGRAPEVARDEAHAGRRGERASAGAPPRDRRPPGPPKPAEAAPREPPPVPQSKAAALPQSVGGSAPAARAEPAQPRRERFAHRPRGRGPATEKPADAPPPQAALAATGPPVPAPRPAAPPPAAPAAPGPGPGPGEGEGRHRGRHRHRGPRGPGQGGAPRDSG